MNNYIVTVLPCISKSESFPDWSRFLVVSQNLGSPVHNLCRVKRSVVEVATEACKHDNLMTKIKGN